MTLHVKVLVQLPLASWIPTLLVSQICALESRTPDPKLRMLVALLPQEEVEATLPPRCLWAIPFEVAFLPTLNAFAASEPFELLRRKRLSARASTGAASSASTASSASWCPASALPAHLRAPSTLHGVESVVVVRIFFLVLFLFCLFIGVDVHLVETRCKGTRWVASA